MSRKRRTLTRIILKDAKYKSDLILKLMNSIMYDGKKTVSEKIIYKSLQGFRDKGMKTYSLYG